MVRVLIDFLITPTSDTARDSNSLSAVEYSPALEYSPAPEYSPIAVTCETARDSNSPSAVEYSHAV